MIKHLMVLIDETHPEFKILKERSKNEFINLYVYNKDKADFLYYSVLDKTWESFEEVQKYYNGVYATDPRYLIGKKIQIPYFYNVSGDFTDFREFNIYYSQLSGASAVFVNDRTLNKFSCWSGLNSYLLNPSIGGYNYSQRKFFTPKLHIGYIYDGDDSTFEVIKKVISLNKANWVFHLYVGDKCVGGDNVILYDGENFEEKLFENVHVLIGFNDRALRSLSSGVVPISNLSNFSNILFDKTHYFKLDFCEANCLIDILRYCDKRREKLERMSELGRKEFDKYFNVENIVKQKYDAILEVL